MNAIDSKYFLAINSNVLKSNLITIDNTQEIAINRDYIDENQNKNDYWWRPFNRYSCFY